jgi:hypothetical protein
MSHSVVEYLKHIQDEITYLKATSEELTLNKFERNETLKRAFVRMLERDDIT